MKIMNFRYYFSQHLLAAAFIFVLLYQVIDILINYFISGDIRQGFSNYYRSGSGREDLLRFVILLILFIIFGIASRKVIQQLEKAQDENIRHLNDIKNFAHSVIHDVKNPAIGIHTMAMILTNKYSDVIDKQGKHYFEIMQSTSKDIVELMELVNTFVRCRECPLNLEAVDLQSELRSIQESINPLLEVRKITWVQYPETLPTIRADRLSIHRIFRNLIDNALKYGGNDLSQLVLEYHEHVEFHTFCVCDNGAGIDESEQEDLFELYKRAKGSGRVDGLGLGLATVKELVEKHQGSIWMNSKLGKGTTFIFTISRHL